MNYEFSSVIPHCLSRYLDGKKLAVSNLPFQVFQGVIGTLNKNDFSILVRAFLENLFCTFSYINRWFGGPFWQSFNFFSTSSEKGTFQLIFPKKEGYTKVPILREVLLFWMQLWPVVHFFHSLLGGCNSKATANPPKSEWKKWATGQSCIRKRSITCKIGTWGKKNLSV